jgi:hypothetical protein
MDNTSKNTPSPDEERAARRASMLQNLDAALAAAQELHTVTAKAFPEAAAQLDRDVGGNLQGLSVDKRLALGNAVAGDLAELAFNLDPDSAMDCLEQELPEDTRSLAGASAAILKAKGPLALE